MAATTSQDQSTQLQTEITSALTSADTTATQSVQNLKLVQQARLSLLTRTAASLTAKYGASDPRAISAQAAVTATTATVARVSMVHQQIAATGPEVSAEGWALYGHVYNAQSAPVSAYCVFLVDEQNAYKSAYGFTYTDSSGYFVINYGGSTETSAEAIPSLFVEIANANAQIVYLGATAFPPAVGAATYQDITLPVGEPVIGDPPSILRKIALPNTDTKKS